MFDQATEIPSVAALVEKEGRLEVVAGVFVSQWALPTLWHNADHRTSSIADCAACCAGKTRKSVPAVQSTYGIKRVEQIQAAG